MTRMVVTLQLLVISLGSAAAWTTSNSNPIGVFQRRQLRQQLPLPLFSATNSNGFDNADDKNLAALKSELEKYLEARKQASNESPSTDNKPKIVGGSRGNLILEFVSAAPNMAQVVEEDPDDLFCYAELEKYGFTDLVAPIMDNGGRLAMYELLGLPMPAIRVKPESPIGGTTEIIIDKSGQTDSSRYSGLKMGLLDDNAMAEALQAAQTKQKEGLPLRSPIAEEQFMAVKKGRRNVGPKMTPDWTPERIDDELSRQGDAISWARNARNERLITDTGESLDLNFLQLAYSVITVGLIAVSFGKATPTFLTMIGIDGGSSQVEGLLDVLKVPSIGLCAASLASSVLCSKTAAEKKRDAVIWTMKGLLGGPLAIRNLQELPQLLTRAELEDQRRKQVSR